MITFALVSSQSYFLNFQMLPKKMKKIGMNISKNVLVRVFLLLLQLSPDPKLGTWETAKKLEITRLLRTSKTLQDVFFTIFLRLRIKKYLHSCYLCIGTELKRRYCP